jgi:acyl-CoA reductase-like NAD-dependent aldehyde dehydrogenase
MSLPSTEKVTSLMPKGASTEAEKEVLLVVASFAEQALSGSMWKLLPRSKKTKLLISLSELIQEHALVFAELEALETGKPKNLTPDGDILCATQVLRNAASVVVKESQQVVSHDDTFSLCTPFSPVGVVAARLHWSCPLLKAATIIGFAISAGCTVVLKPHEKASLSAFFGSLFKRRGFLPGW